MVDYSSTCMEYDNMNEKAIFEIGNIIRVRLGFLFKKLSAEEIIDSEEYRRFKENNPELCKLAEENK